MRRLPSIAVLGFAAFLARPAPAGEADVVGAEARAVGPRLFRFDVTVRHGDTGWVHYADRWEVVGPDGKVLATRVLRHPHVDEQPFTRSLPRVFVPEGVEEVVLRAHDRVHGLGGEELRLKLPASGAGASGAGEGAGVEEDVPREDAEVDGQQ